MVQSYHISIIYTATLLLILQASLEAKKSKKGTCPIGFEIAYLKDTDDAICYRLKGPENFTDSFKDCSGNLYTTKLYDRLNINNYTDKVVWTEYKSAYPGGPYVDTSFTPSVGSLLESSFDMTNSDTGDDEDLCIVKHPIGNFTAVRCDGEYNRYCFVEMLSNDTDSNEGCDGLENSKIFWSPIPICLTALTAVGGGTIRATWSQAKELCDQRGGDIFYSGWRYSNSPQLHISEPYVFPLRVTYDNSHNRTVRNGVDFVRQTTSADGEYEQGEVSFGALNYTNSASVNSTYVFYNVICERDVLTNELNMSIKVDNRNKLILTSNTNIDVKNIYCFTDSKTYYPTHVKITAESRQTYILKPENDGNYWCICDDTKHFKVSMSDRVLWIREEQSLRNTYAVKLYFPKEYTFKTLDDISEIWERKLRDYIYYSTEFYNFNGDASRIEDPEMFEINLKKFRKAHPELSPKGKDIIFSMNIKRIYLDRRTAIVHFEMNPTMRSVQVGTWNNLTVIYMKPVFYCTVDGMQFRGSISKDCAVHNCVGDFIHGVQVVTESDPGCEQSTTRVVPRSAEVTISLPILTPEKNKTHDVITRDNSSEEINETTTSTTDVTTMSSPRPTKSTTHATTHAPETTEIITEPTTPTTAQSTETTTSCTDTTTSTPMTTETAPQLLIWRRNMKENIVARTVSPMADAVLKTLASFPKIPADAIWEPSTLPTEIRAMVISKRDEYDSSGEELDSAYAPEVILTPLTYRPRPTVTTPEITTDEPDITISSTLDTVITAVPSFPTDSFESEETTLEPIITGIPSEMQPEEQLQQVLEELEHLFSDDSTVISVDVIAQPLDNVDQLLSRNATLEIPSQLLHLLDKIGNELYLNGSDEAQTVRSNVALLVANAEPGMPVNGLRITASESDSFVEGNFEIIRDDLNTSHLQSDTTEAVVQLPRSVSNTSQRISFVVFRNDRAFQTNNTLLALNSRVLSINVPNVTHFEGDETIDIYFNPLLGDLHRNQSRTCAYWHFDENGGGFWSEEGCTFVPASAAGMLDSCQCTHLTHFAEILVSRELFSELDEKILQYISVIGCCVSIFGLTVIGITAALFRSWRKDFNNKVWFQLCISIMLLVTCFIIVVFVKFKSYNATCIFIGILLHYSVLASFCWMLVAAIISYRRLVMVFTRDASHKLMKAAAFAWGAPFGVIGILLSVNPSAYQGHFEYKSPTSAFCYPSGLSMWLSIYAPIAVMLVANWTLFILIVRSVFASRSIQRYGDSKEAMRCASVSCLLVFLFGLPWIFGIFAFNVVAAYFFAFTATFQGFVLFIFFVIGNKKTRDLWLNKLKIKQTRKVPVTSSTYTNRSTGGVGSRAGASATVEAKVSKPRSLTSQDDSRFS